LKRKKGPSFHLFPKGCKWNEHNWPWCGHPGCDLHADNQSSLKKPYPRYDKGIPHCHIHHHDYFSNNNPEFDGDWRKYYKNLFLDANIMFWRLLMYGDITKKLMCLWDPTIPLEDITSGICKRLGIELRWNGHIHHIVVHNRDSMGKQFTAPSKYMIGKYYSKASIEYLEELMTCVVISGTEHDRIHKLHNTMDMNTFNIKDLSFVLQSRENFEYVKKVLVEDFRYVHADELDYDRVIAKCYLNHWVDEHLIKKDEPAMALLTHDYF